MEDEEGIVEVVQDDQGVMTRNNNMENSASLMAGLRLDVKKDSGYGSQGVLGLETLRVRRKPLPFKTNYFLEKFQRGAGGSIPCPAKYAIFLIRFESLHDFATTGANQ